PARSAVALDHRAFRRREQRRGAALAQALRTERARPPGRGAPGRLGRDPVSLNRIPGESRDPLISRFRGWTVDPSPGLTGGSRRESGVMGSVIEAKWTSL